MSYKSKSRTLVALLLVGLLVAGVSHAAPASEDTPQALDVLESASGVLTGNSAGAFAYYSIAYPGDDSVATIEMHFSPADPVTVLGVGFNVWAANGFFVGQALPAESTTGDGILRLQYGDRTPATWLIQVFNYIPNHSVSYRVTSYGYRESEPAEPVAEPEPAAPVGVASTEDTMTGILVGSAAGSYAHYAVEYPGSKSKLDVELRYVPADPVTAKGVGFTVYGEAGKVVGRGQPMSNTGGEGRLRMTYADGEPRHLTIQVYNYLSGGLLQYSLQTTLKPQ